MSRIARIVVPDIPHHITQRGNGRRDVFFHDQDRLLYLELLGRYAKEYRLGIWAYCLMSNHIHLVATPQRPDSMARTLARTHLDYARYRKSWNVAAGISGRLASSPVLWMTNTFGEPWRIPSGTPFEPEWSRLRTNTGGRVRGRTSMSGTKRVYWISLCGGNATMRRIGAKFCGVGPTRRRFWRGSGMPR